MLEAPLTWETQVADLLTAGRRTTQEARPWAHADPCPQSMPAPLTAVAEFRAVRMPGRAMRPSFLGARDSRSGVILLKPLVSFRVPHFLQSALGNTERICEGIARVPLIAGTPPVSRLGTKRQNGLLSVSRH